MTRSYGPAAEKADISRIQSQIEALRDLLVEDAKRDTWRSLAELSVILTNRLKRKVPEASISAQLRHLRKPEHGRWTIAKRRRGRDLRIKFGYRYRVIPGTDSTWEYALILPDSVSRAFGANLPQQGAGL